jgi:hypothetical protein
VEEKLKHLLSYLIHEYGESATYWFSTNAIGRVDGMKWDNKNDQPITAEEMDLDLHLDDDMDWTANMDAAHIVIKPIQNKVNLARRLSPQHCPRRFARIKFMETGLNPSPTEFSAWPMGTLMGFLWFHSTTRRQMSSSTG